MRRKGLGRVLSVFGLRPVLCLTCGRKSYMLLSERDRSSSSRERAADSQHSDEKQADSRLTPIDRGDRSRRVA